MSSKVSDSTEFSFACERGFGLRANQTARTNIVAGCDRKHTVGCDLWLEININEIKTF